MEKIIQILKCWDGENKKRPSISEKRKVEGKATLEEMYQSVNEKLDDEGQKRLQEYLEVDTADWILETEAFYEWGFKTGFKLALELQE